MYGKARSGVSPVVLRDEVHVGHAADYGLLGLLPDMVRTGVAEFAECVSGVLAFHASGLSSSCAER